MTSPKDRARDALNAQDFTAPGPELIERVMDAVAREQEEPPAGTRIHTVDYAELLADTPELIDRTSGPLTKPGIATSRVIADVVTKAKNYVLDELDS